LIEMNFLCGLLRLMKLFDDIFFALLLFLSNIPDQAVLLLVHLNFGMLGVTSQQSGWQPTQI